MKTARLLGLNVAAEAQTKKADLNKLSSLLVPGKLAFTLNGDAYRVASKVATDEHASFKLADLNGKPVQTPANFYPVSAALARTAAWMRFVFAYNADFDLYVKEYIKAAGLPVDKDMNWAKWFQSIYPRKLYGITRDPEIVDEAIHQVIITALAHRKDLTKFDANRLPEGARQQPLEKQVTTYLEWLFKKRVSEAYEFIKDKLQPEEEQSMWQNDPNGPHGGLTDAEEYNVLDTPEHATPGSQGQTEEASDLAGLRGQFAAYLQDDESPREIEKQLVLYDFFTKHVGQKLKISDYEQYWKEKTGLGFDSLKPVYAKFYRYIGDFMVSAGMVSAEKAKARAVSSSLNIAAVESDEQIIPNPLNTAPEAGPADTELKENSHQENGGSPVLDGTLKPAERPNVNAMREALETQKEMEVGKPIEQKEQELKTEETQSVDASKGTKQIIINIASKEGEDDIYREREDDIYRELEEEGRQDRELHEDLSDKEAAPEWNPETKEYEHPDRCPKCSGRGTQMAPEGMIDTTFQPVGPCSECHGSGKKPQGENVCPGCNQNNYAINGNEVVCPNCNKSYPTTALIWKEAAGSVCECSHHKTYHDSKKGVCHGGEKDKPCECSGKFRAKKAAAFDSEQVIREAARMFAQSPDIDQNAVIDFLESFQEGPERELAESALDEALREDMVGHTGSITWGKDTDAVNRTGDKEIAFNEKRASILDDAFAYFLESKKDKHDGLGAVFNETYTRTGKGEDKYIAISQLMLDLETAFTRGEDGQLTDEDNMRADAEGMLRDIIGDDPNYSEKKEASGSDDTGRIPHGNGAQTGPNQPVVVDEKMAAPAPVAPVQKKPAQPAVKQYGSPVGEKKDVDVLNPDQEDPEPGTNQQDQPRRKTIMPELPNAEMIMQLNASGATEPKVGADMATPDKKRAALREKIAARREERKTVKAASTKFARLKQVAAEEPAEVADGLDQLGTAFGELADAVSNLKQNLDLVPEAPAAETLTARVAAARKFAKNFRQMAEHDPAGLEQAVREVYQGLDETAMALENFAENMGLSLEETAPKEDLTDLIEAEPKVEEKGKDAAGTDAFNNDRDHDGKPKEATSGSDNFVSDRDDKGEPKQPFRVEVPRI